MIAIQFGIPIVPPSADGSDVGLWISMQHQGPINCMYIRPIEKMQLLVSVNKLAVSSGLNCCCHLKFCMLVILLSNRSSRVCEKRSHFINRTFFHLQSYSGTNWLISMQSFQVKGGPPHLKRASSPRKTIKYLHPWLVNRAKQVKHWFECL